MIAFFLQEKKIKTFDALVYLSFLYWIIFKYNDLKKIFNIEFLSSLSNYDGFLSLIITILIIMLFTKYFLKKN